MALGPVVLAVFFGFVAVSSPLAALSIEVRERLGFGPVTVAAPLLACVVVLPLTPAPAAGAELVPFHRVLGLIWRPGLVLALATVPFAALSTFLALDYAAHGWPGAGAGLFGFGAA